MDPQKIRADFPVLSKSNLIYFDSACTSLKPKQVIDAERKYYEELSACAGRSAHANAKKTEARFDEARQRVAKFINSKPEEVIWTKNCTEGLNLVIRSLDYSARKKIVASPLEHHAALLPIMEQERRGVAKAEYFSLNQNGEIDDGGIAEKIDRHTALVVVHHTTNTTGTRAPLEKITKVAHENGALVLVDGAQGVPHEQVDFKALDVDFLAFSGHKMLGPTGIGCLVGKTESLAKLDTFIVGGETVEAVHLDSVKWKQAPKRFEAGIQNYAGAIGLAAACDYLARIGMQNVEKHEREMAMKIMEAIGNVPGATIYGDPDPSMRCALVSFNLKGVSPHQVALMADSLSKIALRSGVFCAQPASAALGFQNGAARASLYIYNTEKEVGIFQDAMQKISRLG